MMKNFTPSGLIFITLLAVIAATIWTPEPLDEGRQKSLAEEAGGYWENDRKEYDEPDKAAYEEFLKTRIPGTDIVPRERLLTARVYMKALQNRRNKGAIPGIEWKERGPSNVGGRCRSILLYKKDSTYNTAFGAGVAGGLWKTTNISDAAPTWTSIDDFFANLAITTLADDPQHPDTMFFGTGEGWYNIDAVQGAGIWRSVDGGENWIQLSSTNNANFYHIQKILVHPVTGDVFACTRQNGLYRSTDHGDSWTKVLGISVQGGTTNRATDIEVAANGDLYAAMGIFEKDGIYKSSNGTTWAKLTSGLPTTGYYRIELATAPSDSNIVYAVYQDSAIDGIKDLYKTTNGGTSWSTISKPNDADGGIPASDYSRNQAWYDLILAVDPNDEDIIYTGGVDLFKSTNQGSSWTQISIWYNHVSYQYVHADQHSIVFSPGSSDTIYFGNDGGLWRTDDGSSAVPTILDLNNGFNVTQYYSCAISPTAHENHFLGGTQDNGTHLFDSPGIDEVEEVTGGDGGFTHIDSNESQYQYTSYTYNNLNRSTNGGNSFTVVLNNSNGRFINPSDFDDVNNYFYSAYSSNRLLRWSNPHSGSIFNFLNFASKGDGLGGRILTHIKVSPNSPNNLYVGTDTGGVYRITDPRSGSYSSTEISPTGGGWPEGYVSCIDVENGDENHILVTFSSYGITSIWETTNGGSSWTAVEGNLPDMPVRWVMFDPGNSDRALIATELGVWSTDDLDGGSTDWQPSTDGLANVRTDMLQFRHSDSLVLAATHGRGMFTSDIFASEHVDFLSDVQLAYVGQPIKFTSDTYKATSFAWDFDNDSVTDATTENPTYAYTSGGIKTVKLTINGTISETKTNYIHVLPNLGTPYGISDGGNFETNPEYFGSAAIAGGINLWQRGVPSNYLNNTVSASNVWKTDLDDDIVDANYTCALYTPSFNFTNSGTYTININIAMETYYSNGPHAIYMEYSLDTNKKWQRLGSNTGNPSGTFNWYNTGSHAVAPDGICWNFSDTSFYNATYNAAALSGNGSVAFRVILKVVANWSSFSYVDGFSIDDFSITGPNNDPLPVELTDFTAEWKNEHPLLKWQTASENNNRKFEILRMREGEADFSLIGSVAGAPNSWNPREYSYPDFEINKPDATLVYYRLRQVDLNGNSEYSKIVILEGDGHINFKIGPNPFNAFLGFGNFEAECTIKIYSSNGKVILNKRFEKGPHKLSLGNVQSGIYFATISSSGKKSKTIKLLKL